MKFIKSIMFTLRILRIAFSLVSVLCLGHIVSSAQSIQSIDVSPNPLVTGRNFSISVTASPDVTRATATFSFQPDQSGELEIPLTRQGLVWTGSGIVPADLDREHPEKAKAQITVFDAAGKKK